MAQTIKLKRSSVAGNIPDSTDLALGEIAINTADGAVYIKKGNNDIVAVHDNDILHINTSTGRVGIGTTSPSNQLHIQSSGTSSAIRLEREDTSDEMLVLLGSSYGYVQNTTGPLGLGGTNSDTDIYINASGNVGIGTTSPGQRFHVSGGVSRFQGTTSNWLEIDSTAGSGNDVEISTRFNTLRFDVPSANSAAYDFKVGGSSKLFMDDSGNVGIGDTTPSSKLHVVGAVQNLGNQDYGIAAFENTNLEGLTIGYDADGNHSFMYSREVGVSSRGLRLNGAIYIASYDGNVGIGTGTNTLSNKLQVDGFAAIYDGLRLGSAGSGEGIFRHNPGTGNQGIGITTGSLNSGGIRLFVQHPTDGGGVGIGTDSPQNPLEINTTNKLGTTFTGGTDGEGIRVTQTNYVSGNHISLIESSYDDSSSTPDARIGVLYNSSGSTLKFGTSNNYTFGITNTAMVINPTGRVGIGTDAPETTLHVDGVVKIGDTLTLKEDGTNDEIKSTANVLYVKADEYSFQDNSNNQRIAISSAGAIEFNNAYTFPTSDGTSNQVLVTDGAGNLSFGDVSGSSGISVTNNANNRVLTGDGTNANAEANLTFDGSILTLTGGLNASGNIDLADNGRLRLGTGDDLQIYHNGSHSYITDVGSGVLKIGGNQVHLGNPTLSEVYLKGFQDGALELYYDNSAKLATTSTGIDVTGTISSGAITSTGTITSGGQFTSASGDVTFRRAGSSTARILIESGNTTSGQNFTVNGDLTSSGRIKTTNGLFQADEDSQKFRQYHIETLDAGGSFLLGKIENSSSTDGGVEGVVRFAYDFGSTTNNCAIHFNFAQRSGTARGTWWYEHDDQDGAADRVHVRLIDDGAGNMYVWVTCVDYAETFIEANWRHGASIADSGTLSSGTLTTGTTLFDTADDPTSEMHIGNLYAHDHIFLPDDKRLKIGTGGDFEIYHDGSSSLVRNYIGDLYIQNDKNDGDIIFRSDDGSGGITPYFYLDGGNTNINFEKNLYIKDNVRADFGDGSDLRIEHNGTTSTIRNYTGNWYFTQYADDQNIIFECDDGSGGIESYLTIDGANNRNRFHKNVLYGDGIRADFGNSSDLKIYHDGSHSYITDSGTGDLLINATNLRLRNVGGVNMLYGQAGGWVKIYYNGSEKFETTNTGVNITGITTTDGLTTSANITLDDARIKHNNTTFSTFDWDGPYQGDSGKLAWTVTGTSGAEMELSSDGSDYTNAVLTVGGQTVLTQSAGINLTGNLGFNDNVKALFGTNHDLEIYHNGSASYIDDTGTGSLYVRGNNLYLQKYTGESYLSAVADGAVNLYYDNSPKLATKSDGVDITGELQSDSLDVDGNADISGNLILGGDLTVQGTTTTLNTATLDVEDKNITLNYGSGDTSGSADGAGITIQDAVDASTDATILWDTGNDRFDFSHDLELVGDGSHIYFGNNNIFIGENSNTNKLELRGGGNTTAHTVYIDNTGQLGLGTSAPGQKLDVRDGTITSRDSTNTNYAELDRFTGLTLKGNGAGDRHVKTPNTDNLVLGTNDFDRVTISGSDTDGQGKVGINRTDPTYNLDVRGKTRLNARSTDNSDATLYIADNADDVADQNYNSIHLDYNLSGSDTLATTDRTHRGMFMDIDSSASGGDNANEHRIYGIDVDIDFNGDSDLVVGGKFHVENNNSSGSSVTNIYGVQAFGINDTSGTARGTNTYGGSFTAQLNHSSTQTSDVNLFGSRSRAYLSTTADGAGINDLTGSYNEIEIDDPGQSATVDQAYVGRFIFNNDDTTNNNVSINDTYLVHGTYSGGAPATGDSYGIYMTSNVPKNYFGSNVGIGTTSPDTLLEVESVSGDGTSAPKVRITNGSTSMSDGAVIGTLEFKNADASGGPHIGHIQGIADSADERTVELAFATASVGTTTERMRIDSSGNVGIGTTSPSYMLDVGGGDFFVNGTNRDWGGTGGLGTHIGTGNFDIYSGVPGAGVHKLRVTNAGSLGIGTISPDGDLEVVASTTVSGASDSVNNVLIGLQSTNRPTIILDTADTTYTNRTWNITNVGSAGTLRIGRNGLDVMSLKNDGKVGIGTDSPAQKLHISGNAEVNGNIYFDGSTTGSHTISYGTGTTQPTVAFWGEDHASYPGQVHIVGRSDNAAANSGEISFWDYTGSSWNQNMVIKKDGKVGIGTTSPSKTFEVSFNSSDTNAGGNVLSGGGAGSGLLIRNTNSTAGIYANLDFRANNADGRISYKYNSTNDGDFHFITDNNDSIEAKMVIKNAGNVGIGTTSPDYALDIRDNTNIQLKLSSIGASANARMTYAVNNTQKWNHGVVASNNEFTFYDITTPATPFKLQQGAATNTLVVHSASRIGIGTNAPTEKLEVSGGHIKISNTGNTNLYINANNSGSDATIYFEEQDSVKAMIQHDASNDSMLFTDGALTDTMTLKNGRVGIGTTTPSEVLDVVGDLPAIRVGNDNATYRYAAITLGTAGGNWHISNGASKTTTLSDLYISRSTDGTDHRFRFGRDSYAFSIYDNADTEKVYLHADGDSYFNGGNVGIGTTSPENLLHLASSSDYEVVFDHTAQEKFRLRHGSSGIYMTGPDTSTLAFGVDQNHDVVILNSSGSTYATFDGSTSRVGIGTTTPDYSLDIESSTASMRVRKTANDATVVIESSTAGAWTTYKSPNYYAGALYNINGVEQWAAGLLQGVDRWTVRKGRSGSEYFTITNPGKVGISQSAPAARFQVEEYGIDTTETSSTATTQIAIHTFAATDFRSARFTVQVTNSTDSTYHTTELLLLHDGTTANITEFGEIFTGSAVEATFDADISSGNVRLLATPASTDSMEFKVVAHTLTT